MRVKIAGTIVAVGLSVACASPTEPTEPTATAPVPPLVLLGHYRASEPGPGSIADLNFYDRTHYLSWRAGCKTTDTGCVESGTFVLDMVVKTLALRDDKSGTTLSLPFSEEEDSATTAIHTLDALTGGSQTELIRARCNLIRSFRAGGSVFTPGSLEEKEDFISALVPQVRGALVVPISNPPSWVADLARQAEERCNALSRIRPPQRLPPSFRPTPQLVHWRGIELYDIPFCRSERASRADMEHDLFTPQQARVASLRAWGDGETSLHMHTPLNVLRTFADAQCGDPIAPDLPTPSPSPSPGLQRDPRS